jgi:Uma2 family endonuclease
MTGMTVMPRESHDWTVHDLDLIPEDGLQYELLDGALLVSPAPVPRHQRAAARLHLLLAAACPPDLEVFFAPLDWRPDIRTSLQPDLLVVRKEDIGPANITRPLLLAVEVLSPSTRRKDAVFKRSKYEDSGVASFWLVDPETPAISAFEMVAGHYVLAGEATGDAAVTLSRPFAVTVIPSTLVDS